MEQVTVRIPASTSNLGPGFDCLGVALSLHNHITIRRGVGSGGNRLVREAARKFFAVAACKPFDFSCEIRGNIPIGRGLGSSATVRLGVLHGLNDIAQTELSREQLFVLCAKLEGHPDNAAPASFGGFTIARGSEVQRVGVSPRLYFILLIPGFEVATSEARRLLPAAISHTNAARNAANVAAIAAAFAGRDYRSLRGCFTDYLHQPFRKKLIPFLNPVIMAAQRAGALGAFLSGSGSTICAVTLGKQTEIAAAMVKAAALAHAQTMITHADNRGVRVLKSAIRDRHSKIE